MDDPLFHLLNLNLSIVLITLNDFIYFETIIKQILHMRVSLYNTFSCWYKLPSQSSFTTPSYETPNSSIS